MSPETNRVFGTGVLDWNQKIDPKIFEALRDFMAMRQLYTGGIKEIRTKLEILDEEFEVHFGHNPIHSMEYRLKSVDSIVDKLRRKGLEVNSGNARRCLTDIAGVRVICKYVDDIYQIAQLLTRQDDVTLLRTKDYIKEPKPNGYRSLHLVVSVPVFLAESTEPVPVEIQIRTIAMDFWASLEHQLRYKSKGEVPDDLKAVLFECAQESAALDLKMQQVYRSLKTAEPSGNAPVPLMPKIRI